MGVFLLVCFLSFKFVVNGFGFRIRIKNSKIHMIKVNVPVLNALYCSVSIHYLKR